jgi:hypothetical protein
MKETIMKVITTLSALALGLASIGMAQAAEPAPAADNAQVQIASTAGHDPYYPNIVEQSSKSRAQVVSELNQAEANGELASASHDAYYPLASEASTASRAQVLSELNQAQADGELASAGHDAYYPSRS